MKIKHQAVQTDKKKRFCNICGTYTVNIKNCNCININHNLYEKRKSKNGN